MVDDRVFYHMDNNYYSGWYQYSEDDWSVIESEDLPAAFMHPSTVNDFYFTPEWDSSTQFTDFEDTSFYKESQDSDDSDYDWDSNDSWDSNDTDWGSDW